MHKTKQIALILPDTLQCAGLQSLLADYFPPVGISTFATFECLSASNGDSFDFYFTQPDIFVMNTDFFLPRRGKTVLLLNKDLPPTAGLNLNIFAPKETIIENLQQLFTIESNNSTTEKSKELSLREIDVLQLIVKGSTNKDIADKLNISLNTVLTHRKNITAKLGIKTVSGLTFYAIINGFAQYRESTRPNENSIRKGER
jgi:DNA-binding CsgD family transcriptional regulator